MRRIVVPLAVLLALLLAAGAAWLVLNRGVGGGGATAAEHRAVDPFTKIEVDGQADVTLVQGPQEALVIEAPHRQLKTVRTEVRDGTLVVSTDDARRWWSGLFGRGPRTPRITVTFRELDTLRATGAVKVRTDRLQAGRMTVAVTGAAALKLTGLAVDELAFAGSGAVKAEVAGHATTQKVTISGAGDYRGAGLASEHATVTVSGAGRVVVNAAKTLQVGLSGAGSVEYIGEPELTQQVRGAGRVKRRTSEDHGSLRTA
jgi:hypothetical protein